MPAVTATIQLGGYISIIKLAVFVILFVGWVPLLNWTNSDAKKLRLDAEKWTVAIFTAGLVGLMMCLFVPMFVIGLCMYLVAVMTTTILYVVHRNSTVDIYEKILTAEHIKSLFVNEKKQAQKITKGLIFITANDNKAPTPQTKTPEFFGYKIAQEFLDDALWRRASNIALTPAAEEYNIHHVIDGVVEKQEPREREEIDYFIYYLKNLADLRTEERRKPQMGRFKVQKNGEEFEWEVTTAGTTAGEQVRLKKLAEYSLMKIADIGLAGSQVQQIEDLKNSKKGVFIVSGPKKSGVTTTFYALIKNHDPFLNNINTLEKNPAGELPNVTQNVFTMSDTGTSTYSKRFQTVLRTGPDIVGVEHCQDKDLAGLSCSAGRDNKMTYITFEAQSVVEAMGQWIKLVGDKKIAVDALNGISNQRLVRKLCDRCREPYEPNKDLLRKFNMPADRIKLFYRAGQTEYDKHGKPVICQKCQGTGFYGQTAIFETIVLTDELRNALGQVKTTNDIANLFRHAKMLYLQEQAIRKVASGITSINEVIRAMSGPKQAQVKKKKSQ